MTFQTIKSFLMALSALYALKKSDTIDLLSIGLLIVQTTFNASVVLWNH
jgi:hypothetical protein